ncbi:unnamed protein product [Adineta steineri]|nr:unnamed protein product [Adineta steineri]
MSGTQKKHFVCKFNGCNNRCDGKHDTNECSDHAHYYDPPVWHVDEVKCEKCGVPRFSNMVYQCSKCSHYYCDNCSFM